MTRRRFLAGAATAATAACSQRPKLPTPNILVLMPDQFRGMDIGVMGNTQVRTPTMDKLAAEGALLRRTYANCPVCCPARGTLLTGKFAHRHGVDVNDAPLPDEEVTIAEILAENGYRTGFVGKWHLEGGKRMPGFVPPGPRRQGFDFWAANICRHNYWNMSYFRDSPEPIEMPGYSARTFTDEAIRFLEQESPEPFCLYVQWGPPHNPYVAPPEYMNLYDPDGLYMRANWVDGIANGSRNDLAGYYAAITFIDDEIGRLLEVLETTGRARDTIVLLTSDHGDMLGSQGARLKRKPWEESIRVPGIVRYPAGIVPADRDDLVFSHVDMVPTLLGLAGFDAPDDMDGTDFSETLLAGKGETRRDVPESAYLQSYTATEQNEFAPWRGVRTARYTYARHQNEPWVLYDNQTDEFQTENLIDQPAHAELRAELDRMTMEWFEKSGDDWTERQDLPYR